MIGFFLKKQIKVENKNKITHLTFVTFKIWKNYVRNGF